MKVGQPGRPAVEARLVRQAVAGLDPAAPRARVARGLAREVAAELEAFVAEDDAALAALGDLKRHALPSPARALATDPDVDTLALFVEQRVARLRARSGRGNTPAADEAERRAIMRDVEQRLTGRYLRHLRSG